MPIFTADIHLNVTPVVIGGVLVPGALHFTPARPGDLLVHVGTLEVEAESTETVLEVVFDIGNGMSDEPGDSDTYYELARRSLSVGDVVVIHTPDGPLIRACASAGWDSIENPAAYGIIPTPWRHRPTGIDICLKIRQNKCCWGGVAAPPQQQPPNLQRKDRTSWERTPR